MLDLVVGWGAVSGEVGNEAVTGLAPLLEGPIVHAFAAGFFLTALPLITWIRKGRSRFSFENPLWLEWVERIGIVVGPATLIGLSALLMSNKHVGGQVYEWFHEFFGYVLAAMLLLYSVVLVLWFDKTTHLFSRFDERFGISERMPDSRKERGSGEIAAPRTPAAPPPVRDASRPPREKRGRSGRKAG